MQTALSFIQYRKVAHHKFIFFDHSSLFLLHLRVVAVNQLNLKEINNVIQLQNLFQNHQEGSYHVLYNLLHLLHLSLLKHV